MSTVIVGAVIMITLFLSNGSWVQRFRGSKVAFSSPYVIV
jgi:hypothetical protein